MTLLGDKVLIKPEIRGEETLESGIVILGRKDPYRKGEVVKVSVDKVFSNIKVGDTVFYEGAGTAIDIEKVPHIVIAEASIVMIL